LTKSPRDGILPKQVAVLRKWIEQGAKWEPHWAFVSPRRPPVPEVKKAGWAKNPIDSFVLSKLEREGLAPSVETGKATLLRRVTLDLTGLPPSVEELDEYLKDGSADAYEKVVDRLLKSSRFGERMAYEWLDAARYADSNGYQNDQTRTLWPWRDWVIEAFNRNQPFDEFTMEQIAGDLLPNPTREQRVATGFNRNHLLNGEGGRIAEESRVDYVVDRVDTTSTVWLGLTLGCARCHDHKYDPFSQKEFYQLYAYFNNIAESGSVDKGGNAAPIMRLPTTKQTETLARLKLELDDLKKELEAEAHRLTPSDDDAIRAVLAGLASPNDWALRLPRKVVEPNPERLGLLKKLSKTKKEHDSTDKAIVETMVMEEKTPARKAHVLIRGAYDNKGEEVKPGVPASLSPLPDGVSANRVGLARWLVAPDNPLTARVTVNRFWQTFFGVGLVKTTEDFGVQGEQPSHPELLDWLAVEFVEKKWDVQGLCRLIVTSAAYRQSSKLSASLRERDPDNRLLARGPRHRLSSSILRDQALSVSGLLVEKIGGPPVKPYQPPGIWEELSFGKIKYVQDKGTNLYRRSLYTFWRRTVAPPNLFDSSPRQVCTVRQSRTNTPLHALTTLNDITFVEASRVLAEGLLTKETTVDARLDALYRTVLCRLPSDAERKVLVGAHERLRQQYADHVEAAEKLTKIGEKPRAKGVDVRELACWTGLVSLVLNLDETLCKE